MANLDRGPVSMPAYSGLIDGAARILTQVDDLDENATGALRFDGTGIVFVEARSVCWAIAVGMERRLTDLLCQQRSPPIESSALEELVKGCRAKGTPVGEALVASGQVSEAGLRSALARQTAEAIVRIAQSGARCHGFEEHTRSGYDARFVFPTSEILARIGANRQRALAAAARQRLADVLVPDTSGVAFVHDDCERIPVLVAAMGAAPQRVDDLLDVCRWVVRLFDAAAPFDPATHIAAASWRGSGLVVWRSQQITFAALCTTRASSTVLLSRLSAALKS
jgi:hypothetical protein